MTRPRDIADGINRIDTSAADATAITIDSSENVGIGTSSPAVRLDITPSGAGAFGELFRVKGTNTGFGQNASMRVIGGNSDSTGLLIQQLGSGSSSGAIASIYNEQNSHLLFGTNNTERMRIDSSGNVGIGTSSPLSILDVKNATNEHIVVSGSSAYGNNAIVGVNDSGGEVGLGLGGSEIEFYTGATERMRIFSDGKVLVTRDPTNTSTNSMSIEFATSAPSSSKVRHINFVNSGQGRGYIRSGDSDSDLPSFVAGSDYRFKTNITDYTGGYDKIKSIPVKQFDETTSGKTGCVGWIAHEVAAVFPDAVEGTKDAVDDDGNPIYQGLAPSAFYPDVVQALQQAITKIETLEAKVTALENA